MALQGMRERSPATFIGRCQALDLGSSLHAKHKVFYGSKNRPPPPQKGVLQVRPAWPSSIHPPQPKAILRKASLLDRAEIRPRALVAGRDPFSCSGNAAPGGPRCSRLRGPPLPTPSSRGGGGRGPKVPP